VSRKFVYQQTHKARAALDEAFSSATPDEAVLFELAVTSAAGGRCGTAGIADAGKVVAAPMTAADPDAIGPDGTVRLRCYLPSADTVWLSAGCEGPRLETRAGAARLGGTDD
jgi:hypothetical protein